jgi:hypothetical protein
MVIATIDIEGDNLTDSFIKILLSKVKKHFKYKHKLSTDEAYIISFELSDNYVEIQ